MVSLGDDAEVFDRFGRLALSPASASSAASRLAEVLEFVEARRGVAHDPRTLVAGEARVSARGYTLACVCPARDLGAAIVLPTMTIAMMNHRPTGISLRIQQGYHAVLVLDGAGWHQSSAKLKLPGNVSLLRLPPCVPELNPVENIWQFLRRNHLGRGIEQDQPTGPWISANSSTTMRMAAGTTNGGTKHPFRIVQDVGCAGGGDGCMAIVALLLFGRSHTQA